MDMAACLDEMTYRLLVCAEDEREAAGRLAIVARWTEAQAEQLRRGESLCADHERLVAEGRAGEGLGAATRGSTA